MVMKKLYGYALWALPDNKSSERLQAIIETFCQRYHSPPFVPHITLVHMMEGTKALLLAQAVKIASQFCPFDVSFTTVGAEEDPYRALYLIAAPTEKLSECYRTALSSFGIAPKKPFFPHISLLYGVIPNEEKEKFKNELYTCLPLTVSISTLSLWSVDGEPDDWKEISRLPLQGS